MEAIVLAGGLGTRLAALLPELPKAMAPVNGSPFLEILLRHLAACGCTRAILSVGYRRETIQQHFGSQFEGIAMEYAIEEKQLGTGGGIRRSLSMVQEDAALVLNGDTFLDADYAAMMQTHLRDGGVMTMAVTPQADVGRYGGVVIRSDRVVGFEEKGKSGPGWINAGAYVLNRDHAWPSELGEAFSFEKDFLVPYIAQLAPITYRVEGFFLDIGVPEDYRRAQLTLNINA
jgi:D-glycero-alpha-D-manno-heptose 1-phosphate guanylyltransferase